jgi:heme-degrading monooxygenase HmoA
MVLEHVPISVIPGREAEFEAVFDEARHLLAGAGGFRSLRLSRCVERPSSYLLLVEWDTLADHVDGFRNSPAFTEWRALVGPLWNPLPDVTHFDELVVMEAGS